MCKVVVTILQETSPGFSMLDRLEKGRRPKEHNCESTAVVWVRADQILSETHRKRISEGQ